MTNLSNPWQRTELVGIMIRLGIYSAILFSSLAFGKAPAIQAGCFDFGGKTTKSLYPPVPLKGTAPVYVSGVHSAGSIPWAAARGVVPLPVSTVYHWLLDHRNWKDMSKTDLEVSEVKKEGYLAFHTVDVSLRLFAFISADWQEQWAYTLLKGSPKKPQEILVSYQKSGGTDHLQNLCGSILLRSNGASKTDIQFYEQTKATRMTVDDILSMHRANFAILQGLNKKKSKVSQ